MVSTGLLDYSGLMSIAWDVWILAINNLKNIVNFLSMTTTF